jgi:hypothetical protein
MQAQSDKSLPDKAIPEARARLGERVAEFVARIECGNEWMLDHTSALEALELVLTHPRPPHRLQTLRTLLLHAARPRRSLGRTAQLLKDAASELRGLNGILVDADLLRIALLEHAFQLKPSMTLQLDLLRAYLRYRGAPEGVLEHQLPKLDDTSSSGRRRAVSARGLERHVTQITQAALRATSPSASRPLSAWSDQELRAAAIALRVFYGICRRPIRGVESGGDLAADFRDFGAPVGRRLVEEANRRGLAWSVEWHEEAHAQILLMLQSVPVSFGRVRADVAEVEVVQAWASGPLTHVVCTAPIPRATDRSDQEEVQRHQILQQPLPVAPMPSPAKLGILFDRLVAEFPWADQALSAIFTDLRARAALGIPWLGMPATLLVGLPGCGKSRLARRLAEELNLPRLDLPLGGTTDSKVLSGTSRGWASGRPSDLAVLLASRRCASALVLLDEIDKAAGSTQNDGGIQSYLLGLLEPETARRHRDNFLKVECDYSRVSWIATANQLSVLSAPLLSRFRVLLVGQPEPGHMRAAAENVLVEMAARWGVERAALPELRELRLPLDQLTSVRQVKQACEAAVSTWAATIQRH